jgi:hypothetical protein
METPVAAARMNIRALYRCARRGKLRARCQEKPDAAEPAGPGGCTGSAESVESE